MSDPALRDRLAEIIKVAAQQYPSGSDMETGCRGVAAALLASEEWEKRKAGVKERPPIVCLCGSTRFWETFRDEGLRLTLEGKIVLSIGVSAPDSMTLANPTSDEGKQQKIRLDALHKHKIDLADEVLVLNVGGYVGESTMREIAHAVAAGKTLSWFEPESRELILARLAAVREENR